MKNRSNISITWIFFFINIICSNSQENKYFDSQKFSNDSVQQIDQYVVHVFEDSKGNLWFGTMARGAARYDGRTVDYFSMKDGVIDNTVAGISEDKDGNIWFGTHRGATRYNHSQSAKSGQKNSFTNFDESKGLHGAGCKFLMDRNGNIWAGTNHGVFRFDGSSFVKFEIPSPEIAGSSYKWERGKVWSLMEDSRGNIWFGRDGLGACKYDPRMPAASAERFTHYTVQEGLCSNNVSRIVEDKQGNMWFACISSDFPEYRNEGGVCRYDGKAITKFTEINGLSNNDIYTIYADKKGNVWIGAIRVGVYRYDGKSFTLFTETDRPDLTVNFGVQSILEDRNGNLWFGFSGGLFRFNGKTFNNITRNGPWK